MNLVWIWKNIESSRHHRGLRSKAREKGVVGRGVCATVNKEKNCVRARVIQIQNRTRAAKLTAINEYRQSRRREKHLV
jgi:hypothetical protein